MGNNEPKMLKVSEVSKLLNIPKSTLYEMIRTRRIGTIRYGDGNRQRIRIEAAEVDRFLQRHRVPARPAGEAGRREGTAR